MTKVPKADLYSPRPRNRPAAQGLSHADLDDLFRALISKVNYAATHYGELDRGVCSSCISSEPRLTLPHPTRAEVSFAVVAEMFDAEPPESEKARQKVRAPRWYTSERELTPTNPSQLVPTEWFPAEERASSGLGTSRLDPLRGVSLGMLNVGLAFCF